MRIIPCTIKSAFLVGVLTTGAFFTGAALVTDCAFAVSTVTALSDGAAEVAGLQPLGSP